MHHLFEWCKIVGPNRVERKKNVVFCDLSTHCTLAILFFQFGPLGGAVFADYGTDLGSGPTVPGKFYLFGKFIFLTSFFYVFSLLSLDVH